MLIVCPSCASTYPIAPERLGPAGRQVRCAACRTQWFVSPADATAIERPATEPEIWPAAAVETAQQADAETFDIRHAETLDFEATADAAPPANPPESRAVSDFVGARHFQPPESHSAPASRPRGQPGRFRSTLVGAARRLSITAVALALVAGIGIAAFARDEVVKRLPAMGRVYAALGAPVNLRGLEFQAVKSELLEADNSTPGPTLVVEGEIANVTRRAQTVPLITVAIRNKGGQPLYTWTVDPPRQRLEAGEAATFRSRVATPPAEGQDVVIRFGAPPGRVAGLNETR